MNGNDLDHKAAELSVAWDTLLAGNPVDRVGVEPELIQTVRQITAAESGVSINADLENLIWTNVIAGTSELWRPEFAAPSAPQAEAGAVSRGNVISCWIMRLAWMVAAGFAGGIRGGCRSRLAMRVAGFLTVDRNRFMLTDNGNRVGKITLDGTLFLGVLTGALGIVTILIYVLLRNRLPFSGWRRSLGYGVMLLAVFGYVLMDPANEDYHLFGPAWLNVATFSSLYIFLGLFTSQIYEWGMKRGLPARALSFQPAGAHPGLAHGRRAGRHRVPGFRLRDDRRRARNDRGRSRPSPGWSTGSRSRIGWRHYRRPGWCKPGACWSFPESSVSS